MNKGKLLSTNMLPRIFPKRFGQQTNMCLLPIRNRPTYQINGYNYHQPWLYHVKYGHSTQYRTLDRILKSISKPATDVWLYREDCICIGRFLNVEFWAISGAIVNDWICRVDDSEDGKSRIRSHMCPVCPMILSISSRRRSFSSVNSSFCFWSSSICLVCSESFLGFPKTEEMVNKSRKFQIIEPEAYIDWNKILPIFM